jgi:hypothetical protein
MAQIMILGKFTCLIIFCVMDPTMERIVVIGFSPPKDTKNLSLEDERNLYLNVQANHVIVNALSDVVTSQLPIFGELGRRTNDFPNILNVPI